MSSIRASHTPLTNETFADFVRTHRFVVIHFWAIWNAHDQVMRRLLDSEIPDDSRESVTFARFEIDPPAHHEICREHSVANIPFLAFYRDGSLVRNVTGLRPPEVIALYLRELVNKPLA
jgi:thioredoxin reductase (NADPH)